MSSPRVLFLMADYGHDPTETAIPFQAFKDAGFLIYFATQHGKAPQADEKMLKGITQKILGANAAARNAYRDMQDDEAFKEPIAWTDEEFTLDIYDLLFFPGGHEKGVRQVIDCPVIHSLLAVYFPQTRRPSQKAVAAICHGVLVLAGTTYPNGKSLLHDVTTTTLPGTFESTAFWGTKWFLGDYYKTYGAGTENVETTVKRVLNDPDEQFRISRGLGPFVVKDEVYSYASGRYPADAALLAKTAIGMVKANREVR